MPLLILLIASLTLQAGTCPDEYKKILLLTYEAPKRLPPPPPEKILSLNEVEAYLERLGQRDLAKKLKKMRNDETSEPGEAALLAAQNGRWNELRQSLEAKDPRPALRELRASISDSIAKSATPPAVDEKALLAGREAEQAFPSGYRTFRQPNEETADVMRNNPLVAQKIEEKTAKMRGLELLKKTSHPATIPHFKKLKKRSRLAAKFTVRERKLITAVWNRMADANQAADYTRALAQDTAVEMAKSGDPRALDALKRGELIRNYVLKTLVKRHRAQGNDAFSTIVQKRAAGKPSSKTRKTGSNDDFRSAVGQGPFFDKPFQNGRHGIDTHFMQIDYASTAIWEATGGNPREFWDLLGSKRGIDLWVALFDGFEERTFARPEYFTHQVADLLRITN